MAHAFKVGARGSALSVIQTKSAIRLFRDRFPGTAWRLVKMETPGDRDRKTPLEKSAPDFFTRDLDEAVLDGRIDCAIHSAKDLPGYSGSGGQMVAEGLDWFWLPVCEDRRDCWVFEEIKGLKALKIGVSSARRKAFAKKVFPKAILPPLRGTIDDRVRQLLAGRYDALLMAVAGLKRLFKIMDDTFVLDGRKLHILPIGLDELPTPEAQGALAVTFRKGDSRFQDMRAHFVKAVRFVSAGVGDAGLCTLTGLRDIENADVVLYDYLMGNVAEVSAQCVATAHPQFMAVGKRCGEHSMVQQDITQLICDEVRKGRRVVRLKGGDAGLFGRLAEETSALEELRIPFVVRPGVSALTAATTGTGILLTRRGESRGFTALTPRSTGADTPLVLFMAVRVAAQEAKKLIADGMDSITPCTVVFDAAGPSEAVWQGTLAQLAAGTSKAACRNSRSQRELAELAGSGLPGLVIVGKAAARVWPKLGCFAGRRMLVTASEAVQPRVRLAVEDLGGRPISWPMIELCARKLPDIEKGGFDAIVLTSPSAARIFFSNCIVDRRRLPMFFTCGAGTDAELRRWGVSSDVMPEKDFSAAGLVAAIRKMDLSGAKILRLRSAKAGTAVADALRAAGATVVDHVLYDNKPVKHAKHLPPFDDIHFASASAVEAFLDSYGVATLRGKGIYVMGEPTRAALPPRLRSKAQIFETWHS